MKKYLIRSSTDTVSWNDTRISYSIDGIVTTLDCNNVGFRVLDYGQPMIGIRGNITVMGLTILTGIFVDGKNRKNYQSLENILCRTR